MKLGTLKKVDLRSYWKHEALDFTTWLAKEEKLELLSDEIGIDAELEETEASVGRFNVRTLGKNDDCLRQLALPSDVYIQAMLNYRSDKG